MPYKIVTKLKDGKKKYCVVNKDTDQDKGCSDTYEKAVAHQRALYAADDEERKNNAK